MSDDKPKIGTTTVAREGVLEEILGYSGTEFGLYTFEGETAKQEYLDYGISTRLSVRFDDAPDGPEVLSFPLQINLPLSMKPEGGWRIRYTFECIEPVTGEKLDAYAAAGVPFGTYDENVAARNKSVVETLFDALEGKEFVDAVTAIGTNRRCRRTLEFLKDDDAVRTYSFTASDWERDVWEQYKDKLPETL